MRSKILALVSFFFFFGIQPALFPALQALEDPLANSSGDLAPALTGEDELWPFERPSDDGGPDPAEPLPSGSFEGAGREGAAPVVTPQMPPLIFGQHEGETVLIALDESGSVISMVKYAPGLDEPLAAGQELQTIFDLGFGLNGQLAWDIASGAITFALFP